MNNLLQKKIIRREISVLHFFLLLTGKLMMGISIGLSFTEIAFPYSYPLFFLGISMVLPTLNYLMKEEIDEEKVLKKKLKKN